MYYNGVFYYQIPLPVYQMNMEMNILNHIIAKNLKKNVDTGSKNRGGLLLENLWDLFTFNVVNKNIIWLDIHASI